MAKVPNDVETLPKMSIAWVGCTNVTDDRQTTDDRRQTTDDRRQTTDGRTTTYSEHEHEFTFAKNGVNNSRDNYCIYHFMLLVLPSETAVTLSPRMSGKSAKSKSVNLSCFRLMPYNGLAIVFLTTKSMMRRNKNRESTQPCRTPVIMSHIVHGVSLWRPNATFILIQPLEDANVFCKYSTRFRYLP